MSDLLGYTGKKVVITGAATGMGASAAELLVQLGAEVYALDIADVKAPVHRYLRTDLKSKASIDEAIAAHLGSVAPLAEFVNGRGYHLVRDLEIVNGASNDDGAEASA